MWLTLIQIKRTSEAGGGFENEIRGREVSSFDKAHDMVST